jgi:hypothetical protein
MNVFEKYVDRFLPAPQTHKNQDVVDMGKKSE